MNMKIKCDFQPVNSTMEGKILKFLGSSSRLYNHDIIPHQLFGNKDALVEKKLNLMITSHWNYELCVILIS